MEQLFQSIGLSESKAKDTIKNANVSNVLKSYILQVRGPVCGAAHTSFHKFSVCIGTGAIEWRHRQKDREFALPFSHKVSS